MKVDTMILLIETVDELSRLNEALKNLTTMGYQETFSKLDNVFDVIKRYSIFKDKVDIEARPCIINDRLCRDYFCRIYYATIEVKL